MSSNVLIRSVFLGALVALTTACTKSDKTPGLPGAGATPAGTEAAADAAATREVNLAIWANYLSPEMAAQFTEKTGIKLKISNFSSNEELLAKIQAGAAGIDVAVPSDYMVDVMTKLELLQPLDHSQVANYSGLDPAFLKQPFDKENKFSLPYAWGTAGLAINRDLYKGEIKGYKDLFTKADLAGKISLLDDVREVMGAALKANGYSVNSTNPEELKKAQEMLKAARPRVKMFRSDTIDALVQKEVAVAQTFSVDGLQASVKAGSKIEYIIPVEGGTRNIDNLVILKTSQKSKEALELINFLLSKEANLDFVKTNMGGPVVLATKAALPKEISGNKALFPPASTMSKLESIHDVGETTRLYDRLWTELKTE